MATVSNFRGRTYRVANPHIPTFTQPHVASINTGDTNNTSILWEVPSCRPTVTGAHSFHICFPLIKWTTCAHYNIYIQFNLLLLSQLSPYGSEPASYPRMIKQICYSFITFRGFWAALIFWLTLYNQLALIKFRKMQAIYLNVKSRVALKK